jgi:hypothetical protein
MIDNRESPISGSKADMTARDPHYATNQPTR